MKINPVILSLILLPLFTCELYSQQERKTFTLENESISAQISVSGILSLTSPSDTCRANVVNGSWRKPEMVYKILDGDWLDIFGGSK